MTRLALRQGGGKEDDPYAALNGELSSVLRELRAEEEECRALLNASTSLEIRLARSRKAGRLRKERDLQARAQNAVLAKDNAEKDVVIENQKTMIASQVACIESLSQTIEQNCAIIGARDAIIAADRESRATQIIVIESLQTAVGSQKATIEDQSTLIANQKGTIMARDATIAAQAATIRTQGATFERLKYLCFILVILVVLLIVV